MLATQTGLPFQSLFRTITVFAHFVAVLGLWQMLGRLPAAAYALCPPAVLIAGFHGNTDPILIAFLIWAVHAAERQWPSWLVGLLFAASASIKVWPLLLAPMFLLSLPNWRSRVAFSAATTAGVVGYGLPFTIQFPALLIERVLGYRSLKGWWGLSALVPGYDDFGLPIAFGGVLIFTWLCWRRGVRLYATVGLCVGWFLVTTTGFGVQYWIWLLPFCLLWGKQRYLALFAVSTLLLVVYYTHLSGGFPWHFADMLRPGASQSWLVVYTATVAWLTLAAVFASAMSESLGPLQTGEARPQAERARAGSAA